MSKKILFGLVLGICMCFSLGYADTLSEQDYTRYTKDKGWMVSDKFPSAQLCQEEKGKYSSMYTSYQRSECFSYKNSVYYFICAAEDTCIIGSSVTDTNSDVSSKDTGSASAKQDANSGANSSSQNKNAEPDDKSSSQKTDTNLDQKASSQTTTNAITLSQKQLGEKLKRIEKYIPALHAFLTDVAKKTSNMNEKNKEVYLNDMVTKFEKMRASFAGNENIQLMLDYLKYGVQSMYKKPLSEEEIFFCMLRGECDENAKMPSPDDTKKTDTKSKPDVPGPDDQRSPNISDDQPQQQSEKTGEESKTEDTQPVSNTPQKVSGVGAYITLDKNDTAQRFTSVSDDDESYLVMVGIDKTQAVGVCLVNKSQEELCNSKEYYNNGFLTDSDWKDNFTYVFPAPLGQKGTGRINLPPATYVITVVYDNGRMIHLGDLTMTDSYAKKIEEQEKKREEERKTQELEQEKQTPKPSEKKPEVSKKNGRNPQVYITTDANDTTQKISEISYMVEYPFYMMVTGIKKSEVDGVCLVNSMQIELDASICQKKENFMQMSLANDSDWKGDAYVMPSPIGQYGAGRLLLGSNTYHIHILYTDNIIADAGKFRIYDPRYGEEPMQK